MFAFHGRAASVFSLEFAPSFEKRKGRKKDDKSNWLQKRNYNKNIENEIQIKRTEKIKLGFYPKQQTCARDVAFPLPLLFGLFLFPFSFFIPRLFLEIDHDTEHCKRILSAVERLSRFSLRCNALTELRNDTLLLQCHIEKRVS